MSIMWGDYCNSIKGVNVGMVEFTQEMKDFLDDLMNDYDDDDYE